MGVYFAHIWTIHWEWNYYKHQSCNFCSFDQVWWLIWKSSYPSNYVPWSWWYLHISRGLIWSCHSNEDWTSVVLHWDPSHGTHNEPCGAKLIHNVYGFQIGGPPLITLWVYFWNPPNVILNSINFLKLWK